MIEDILANHSIAELFDKKPLRDRKKPLDAAKDLKGILGLGAPEKLSDARYAPSWEDVRALMDEEVDISTKISSIEDSELSEDAVVSLTGAYGAIRDQMPLNQSTTLFGVDDRPPSRSEQSMFIRKLQVMDDPRRVIDLLKAGQLSGLEVDILQQFYPIYYNSLVETILEQMVDAKDVKLSRRMNAQLGLLLGVPRVTPEAMKQLQASHAPTEEAPQEGEAPDLAEAQMTKPQKTEFT